MFSNKNTVLETYAEGRRGQAHLEAPVVPAVHPLHHEIAPLGHVLRACHVGAREKHIAEKRAGKILAGVKVHCTQLGVP